jgi:ArsR family transcriptional regulator
MIIYVSYVLFRPGLEVDAEQFQRIAKALADPRRFEILEQIAKQSEMGCRHLCGCFPVRQATISHHLKELASAGLVESRKDGQFVYYKTRRAVLEDYMSELRRRMYGGAGGAPGEALAGRPEECDSPAGANRAVAASRDE